MFLFVVTTLLSLATYSSYNIGSKIASRKLRMTQEELELYTKRNEIENEKSKIRMVDEFAKHAKLQRQIIKIDEQLKNLKLSKASERFYKRMIWQYGLSAIMFLIMVVFTLCYRGQPVIVLEPRFDLFPFNGIFSFANTTKNAISVEIWIMCCLSLRRYISTLI